jgi:hypothetical protein
VRTSGGSTVVEQPPYHPKAKGLSPTTRREKKAKVGLNEDATTLSKTTFSIMALSIMTVSIMSLTKMTLSIMTLTIMTK